VSGHGLELKGVLESKINKARVAWTFIFRLRGVSILWFSLNLRPFVEIGNASNLLNITICYVSSRVCVFSRSRFWRLCYRLALSGHFTLAHMFLAVVLIKRNTTFYLEYRRHRHRVQECWQGNKAVRNRKNLGEPGGNGGLIMERSGLMRSEMTE
jgi:hypothetical protein